MNAPQRITFPNGWGHNISSQREVFPRAAISQALSLIARWCETFPRSGSWAEKEYGVPSLLIRLDCVCKDGVLAIYEIEERPCGVGVTLHENADFRPRFEAVRRTWPEIVSVRADERVTDDSLWMREVSLEEAHTVDAALLVRSRPEDARYHALEPRAISTVTLEGDKRYGIALGMWTPMTWVEDGEGGYIDNFPSSSFVAKPLQGTRARSVLVYMPKEERAPLPRRARKSLATEGQVRRAVQRQPMVMQPFIWPQQRGEEFLIYRMYFAYNTQQHEYVPVGGMWTATDELVVHGTDRSTFGPLVMAE